MKWLLALVSSLQDRVAHDFNPAPPCPSENNRAQQDAQLELPELEKLELARLAAARLYRSLGSLCPNPSHDHDILFKLDTRSSFQSLGNGVRSGKFELRVAFQEQGSIESPIWFDIDSIVKPCGDIFEDGEDMMDVDRFDTSPGTEGERSHDLSVTQHHRGSRSQAEWRPSFSSTNTAYGIREHTAQFCLANHRQQMKSAKHLAAKLEQPDAWNHAFYYPAEKDLEHVARHSAKIQTLGDVVKGSNLRPSHRVRLARIIAESTLKFDPSEWLRCDLSGDNVLVYMIGDNLEPHLQIRLYPDSQASSPIRTANERSQVLLKLAATLFNIGVGSRSQKQPQMDGDADNMYEMVNKAMRSRKYAEVVRQCQQMAMTRGLEVETPRSFTQNFYSRVVRSLRRLEESFSVTR